MDETIEPARRVCIVLLSGIGDVVHGLPVVNALERDDRERRITWVVQSEAAPLLGLHPAVDEVLTFDRKRGWREVLRLRQLMNSERFDLTLNFTIYFKAAIPTFFARSPHKVSFGRDRARDLVWLFANRHLPPRGPAHRQDEYFEFLDYLGIERDPIEWRIILTEEEKEAQREYFSRLDGIHTVGMVLTSGRSAKDWSTERFAEVATACERDFGLKVILLGGPSARERGRAMEVVDASGANLGWELGPHLRRLLYLIKGCDLVIAPDTGPLHIARAVGTPVIGLYGHTDPLRVGPYKAYEDLWIDRYNFDGPETRSPFTASGARHDRMRLVRVEDVLEKVERALARYTRPTHMPQADDAELTGR